MRSELQKKGREITYTIEADGFLRYMVRTIVGTLLEVGRGKLEPQAIEDLFARKKRSLASPTAPAKGLCLIKVIY
jgi:tRNA pseudouridine38-40 synthase